MYVDLNMLCYAKSLLSCLTLCDPIDGSPPGSSVHGILQARRPSGLPCPPPGDLPYPGIKPRSPALQAISLLSVPPEKPIVWVRNLLKRTYTRKTW